MKRAQQFSFFKSSSKEFGGTLLLGKRKERRPLSLRNPIHIVLKSERARGSLSLVNCASQLEKLAAEISKKHQVKIYNMTVNFNHIHAIISFKRMSAYKAWVRQLTSAIVQYLERKNHISLKGFFNLRPFTRIMSWGRDLKNALDYLVLNKMEVVGLRPAKKKMSGKIKRE